VDNANPAVIASHPEESEEIAKLLVEHCTAGNVVALGLESADPVVAAENDLYATPKQTLDAIKMLNRVGGERGDTGLPELLPGINFLGGLKGETKQTYDLNLAFLEDITYSKLLLRRINIRQVAWSAEMLRGRIGGDGGGGKRGRGVGGETGSGGKKGGGVGGTEVGMRWGREGARAGGKRGGNGAGKFFDRTRFLRFKESVRERIDRPMLRRLLPEGVILKDVYLEINDGNVTFGRQMGTYPLLVGIPYKMETGEWVDVAITSHGRRSVTGISYPMDINNAPVRALEALPGIGRKRALRIFHKRPIRTEEELVLALEEKDVVDRVIPFLSI
ncbi:MAG: hypothetical protein KAT70_05180, partial [Thermoplasmata archaeon]|nr:hypothetical protein [Thermoplasmata archaeon]